MHKILIVDDDVELLEMVNHLLIHEGYRTLKARSAHEALVLLDVHLPSLILIDVMMPGMDGIALCRQLRNMPEVAPIPMLFLTALNSGEDVVRALNAGADDYIRKPFATRELMARIRAHLRRFNSDMLPNLRLYTNGQVFLNGRELDLTRVELNLLVHLCKEPDQWHSANNLLEHVWAYPNGAGDTALVRNHIRNLRRKLETSPERPAVIQSRHRRGYMIRALIQFDQPVEVAKLS